MPNVLIYALASTCTFILLLQNGANASKINSIREDIKKIKKHLGIPEEEK